MQPAHNKNCRCRVSIEFPCQILRACKNKIFTSHFLGLGGILCESTERDLLLPYIGIPLDFAHVPFPFADFALWPSTLINCMTFKKIKRDVYHY